MAPPLRGAILEAIFRVISKSKANKITMTEKELQKQQLELRQVELSNVLSEADGHALEYIKGLASFKKLYPEESARYAEALTEYRANRDSIAQLQEEIDAEEAEAKAEQQAHPMGK